uniref:Uncharacterized protein n=1 Tax=Nelumbo nucifera TaxID=4432 RepID=A0A822ZH90_NELNU|nr:TPA_asm: hypothetical protein HUJ06_002732 [Nelumbo nucifera]
MALWSMAFQRQIRQKLFGSPSLVYRRRGEEAVFGLKEKIQRIYSRMLSSQISDPQQKNDPNNAARKRRHTYTTNHRKRRNLKDATVYDRKPLKVRD